jgi:hypothetical protein
MVTAKMNLRLFTNSLSGPGAFVNNVTLPQNIGSLAGTIPNASLNISGMGLSGEQ